MAKARKKKMQYSLTEHKNRTTDKEYKYESFWGTRGTKSSKKTSSILLAKHPVMTWAKDLEALLAFKGHTDKERADCKDMIEAIDGLGDFNGIQTFDLDVPSDGMRFQALISRITT